MLLTNEAFQEEFHFGTKHGAPAAYKRGILGHNSKSGKYPMAGP